MKKRNIGDEIIKGLEQTFEYVQSAGKPGPKNMTVHKVKIPNKMNVQKIRSSIGLSQADFAATFGFSRRTVQNWEQGITMPSKPARTLLSLIKKDPKTISRLLFL